MEDYQIAARGYFNKYERVKVDGFFFFWVCRSNGDYSDLGWFDGKNGPFLSTEDVFDMRELN